jgi:hypothetical protein
LPIVASGLLSLLFFVYKIKGESMNFLNNFVSKSFVIVLSVFCLSLDAKYQEITNKRKYNDFINQYQYTVLCFVDSTPDELFEVEMEKEDRKELRQKKKEHKQSIRLFERALKAASLTGDYKKLLKKDVGFLVVDVAKRSVEKLGNQFLFDELPSCVLLNNGEPVDEYDQPVKISGASSKKDFLDFLDDYAQDELDELKDQREEEAEQKRVERIARLNAQARYYGWNPYGGYGSYYGGYGMYPYYSPYGYRRAHVGFGIAI